MIRIFTIAGNTFTEVIRQPVYLIILACSMALILLSPYFTMFAMLENNRMIKDMSLATILLTGLLLSAFSAASVIYQEVENGTILTIITKPVKRSSFILGKYLGLLTALLVAEYLLALVLVQLVRTEITEAAYSRTDYPVFVGYIVAAIITLLLAAFANFFYEKPFVSSAVLFALPVFSVFFFALCLIGYNWKLQPILTTLDMKLLIAILLVFLATALLTAVATAASTRMPPLPTLVLCAFVFLMGLFSDYLFGRHVDVSYAAKVIYNIIPNLQIYWVIDAVLDDRAIPVDYVGYILGYTALYLAGILALAMALFEEREAR